MAKLKTYLAGAFCPYNLKGKEYPDWRDFVKEKLSNDSIQLHDPRFESNQLCPATFTMDDAEGVINSDILLHFRIRGYEDEGASWEQGIAFACNLFYQKEIMGIKEKLIVYVDDTHVPFPLHFASANLTFNSLEIAVELLNNIRSLEKFDIMPAYMDLMSKEKVKR